MTEEPTVTAHTASSSTSTPTTRLTGAERDKEVFLHRILQTFERADTTLTSIENTNDMQVFYVSSATSAETRTSEAQYLVMMYLMYVRDGAEYDNMYAQHLLPDEELFATWHVKREWAESWTEADGELEYDAIWAKVRNTYEAE